MKQYALRFVSATLLVAMLSWFGFAQGAGSSLTGTVKDQSGGVVPGADVAVKNNDTGAEFKAVTAENGTFSIPALDPGTYTATVTVPNFKQAIIKDIKLTTGTPATITVTLQVGGSSETVTVTANAEVIQSASANISNTLSTNQLQQLPASSRNALDFLIMLPGVNTTSSARGSTINGLPNNTVSITIDGINTQDNYYKGYYGDGFFSMISPRLDAVEEVTVSTATPGAESAGSGAVQIRFITRSGNNDFHGSLYEYHRNPDFNSGYWFNNRDKTPTYNGSSDPCTALQMATEFDKCKAPRDRVLLNQPGGRIGGPITLPKKLFGPLGFSGKDKAFFFVNYEEYRLPAQATRTRSALVPTVAAGNFLYTVGSATAAPVSVLNLPFGNTVGAATIDPTIAKLLADINSASTQGTIKAQTNPALNDVLITNKALTIRKLMTSRFDFNLTSKQRLEISYSFHRYVPVQDQLNGYDPSFPGFPNQGAQGSNRFTNSNALRSTLTPRLVNEARFGLIGGITLFNPDVNPGSFAGPVANQDGYALGISQAMSITNAYRTNSPSRRNAPTKSFDDTMTWTRGAHSISFGGSFMNVHLFLWSQQQVPSISFGMDTTYDPARTMFDSTNGPKNFPGASSAQYGNAQSLYAVLTGRVTSIGGSAVLSEVNNQYTYNGKNVQRGSMNEMGYFVTDSWRMRPGLTVNYGLRWEVQFPFSPGNNVYTTNTVDDLWGISGHQNYGNGVLYTPGNLVGQNPTYKQFAEGTAAYNTHWRDFAPSVGFAWSPNAMGFLSHILGENGRSVFRGGFSVAYNRESMGDYSVMYGSNPGITVSATRSQSNGNLVANSGTDVMPVLFRDKTRLGPPTFATTPVYPLQSTSISDQVNLFDPNTRTPYTMSWTFGLQRELSKDMVLEVRYVGTRNLQPWTQRQINEQNIVENGFLSEFKNAMANLQANIAAGRGSNFKYFGAGTGTSPLPITLAYFSGVPAAQASDTTKYNLSTNWSSSTYVNTLAQFNANPGTYANNLWSSSLTQRNNALTAGLPANEFFVNPTVASGGSYLSTNGGFNRYDGVVVELRRRLSKGLLVQANYTFAKAMDSSRQSYRTSYFQVLGNTLPDAFKVNWVYEMPFGSGKTFFGQTHGVVDRIIGGWEFQGTARWQSGNLINFGNVRLVGMTLKDLQNAVGLRFDNANKLVFYEPADMVTNTLAAYNTSATTSTGYSTAYGVPSGRYVAPANSGYSQNGCLQVVSGDCAGLTTYVRGPRFQRFDLSMVKRIRFTETKNLELRGEFLNAFNNINFYGTTCATSTATCGQVTSAYTDSSNTQDPGGRLIQLVLRINF